MKTMIKKAGLLCCLLLTISILRAQYVPITDTQFGNWLSGNGYASCLTGSSGSGWQLDTTCTPVLNDTALDIENNTVANIDGIQYFKQLRTLKVSNTLLSFVPTLPASVRNFTVWSCNNFTTFPILPDSLELLDCGWDNVSTLPSSLPSQLLKLECRYNHITSLPTLPAGLQILSCSNNQISALPALPNSLTTLYCASNLITSMPLTLPNSLKNLHCEGNQLTGVSSSYPSSMDSLDCSNNQIIALVNMPSQLTVLNCRNNSLQLITALPTFMHSLFCDNNPSLHCLPVLGTVIEFGYTNVGVSCMSSYAVGNVYSQPPYDSLPICTAGNPDGCLVTLPDSVVVWPGDADANHLVDNTDLLPIGLAYSSTGPMRAVQGIVWQGDTAADWTGSFSSYSSLTNYKHADCDGNGVINADDTLAIMQNFSLTHTKTSGNGGAWRVGVPALTAKLSADTLYAGDTLTVSFILGDSTLPATNIYGLAFTYNFDVNVVDSTYTDMAFPNSWLGNSTDKISISKTFNSSGQIKAATTRIDHTPRSGYGMIAKARFKITTDNISGKDFMYYSNQSFISDITAIDQQGNIIQLNAGADTSQIGFIPNAIREVASERVSMYPNPTHDRVTISADNIINAIVVTDITGREIIHQTNVSRKSATVDVSACEDGLYTVRVKTAHGSGIVKLVVTK